jgi:hypothetical protein
MSRYFQNEILLWLTKGENFQTALTGLYLAAFTANPDADDTGYEEPGAEWTDYARVDVIDLMGSVSGTSSVRFVLNNANGNEDDDILFPEVAVGEGPVTPTGFGLFDSATIGAGNLLFWDDAPDLATQGDQFVRIPAGLLRIEVQ